MPVPYSHPQEACIKKLSVHLVGNCSSRHPEAHHHSGEEAHGITETAEKDICEDSLCLGQPPLTYKKLREINPRAYMLTKNLVRCSRNVSAYGYSHRKHPPAPLGPRPSQKST